ncbi:MAG TPA: hypothetical protein ENL13_04060 [Thermoplasmatales archaeon]|nr:hypothetical protein [Thermoplasmatales archaeon]
MKSVKIMAILAVSILLFSSLLSAAVAEPSDETAKKDRFLDKVFRKIFQIGSGSFMMPWFNFVLVEPQPIRAYPNTINLEYLNQTTIQIGLKNETTGEWADKKDIIEKIVGGYSWGWIYQAISFEFELVTPAGSPPNAWIANFDPKIITVVPNRKTTDWSVSAPFFRTNLTLTLNPSVDPSYPTQDVNLTVRIIRKDVNGGMWLPPKYYVGFWKNPVVHITWPITSGILFTLINSQIIGKTEITEEHPVNVLIRVKHDHFAEIIPSPPMEIHPGDVLSIPVAIKNLGSHIDTFNFKVNTTDKNLKVSPPPSITLNPGETGHTMVSVAAPMVLRDIGTTRSINVEAYSIDQPDKVFSNTLILTTRGVYVSGSNIFYLVIIILVVLFLASLMFYMRKHPVSAKERLLKKKKEEKSAPVISKKIEWRIKKEVAKKPLAEKQKNRALEKRILKIKKEQERQKRKLNT